MARVTLIGATGGIGRHVLTHALAAGHEVTALVRTPSKLADVDGVTIVEGSVLSAERVAESVAGADIVLSCLGTSRGDAPVVTVGTGHVVDAMKQHGVERLAMISSVGVGDSRAQGKRVSRMFMYMVVPLLLKERFYELADAEEQARRLPRAVVVRPTGLTNHAGTGRYRAVDSQSRQTTMRIARDDVARFLVDLVEDTSHDGRSVSLFADS